MLDMSTVLMPVCGTLQRSIASRANFPNLHQNPRRRFVLVSCLLSLPPKPLTSVGRMSVQASKPLTLPAHRLATMLEGSRSPSPFDDADSSVPKPLTHAEEQERLRAETISAFHTDPTSEKPEDSEDEDEGEGGLFTLREKTEDEVKREEEEYRKYLERELREGGVDGLEGLRGLVEVEETEGGVKREEGEENEGGEGEEKKRKGKKERKEEKEKKTREKGQGREDKKESDQEFLVKYVYSLFIVVMDVLVVF